VWFGAIAARSRHRRAERRAAALEAELRTHTAPAPITRPAGARASGASLAGTKALPALAGPK
jgi:hypothetical protein